MKIEMTILKGSSDGDVGGIFFRAGNPAPQSYIFYISAFGPRMLEAVASDNSGRTLIPDTRYVSDVTNQTFVIEIIAHGENIKVCVNNQCYNDFTDGAYNHGAIGVFAQSDQGQTEVQFNDVEVWTL